MSAVVLILVISLMLTGFIGIIVPFLPDLFLIFLGALIYGLYSGFSSVSITVVIIFGVLTGLSFLFDYLAQIYGTKKYQASSWGQLGAVIGLIVGIFSPGFIFIIIGPVIGVIIFELIFAKRTWQESIHAGKGAMFGFLLGSAIKIILALIMIGWFLKLVIF